MSAFVRNSRIEKISSAEREVRRAINELTESEKSAYMEALDKAPDLVGAESRVDRFLRLEKSNVKAAAKLQARYWKDRKAFFGERAFLPLDDLSGNGALDSDDIEALSRGIMVMTSDDISGRPCLLIDESRARETTSVAPTLVQIHCLFYWLSLKVAQNPKAQMEGFNMIRLIRNGQALDQDMVKQSIRVIQRALPVNIYSSHIAVMAPDKGKQEYLETLMPMLLKLAGDIKTIKTKIHASQDKQEMMGLLEADGVPEGSITTAVGGSFDCESWSRNFDLQRNGTKLGVAVAAAAAGGVALAARPEQGDEKMPPIDDSLVKASRVARAQERKERKKQLDVIYARKRREREKEDTEGLQEKCSFLSQENVVLKEQGEKLERLLGEAQRMVEVLATTQAEAPQAQVPPAVVSQPVLHEASSQSAVQQQPAAQPAVAQSAAPPTTPAHGELQRQILQQLLAVLSNMPRPQNQPTTPSPTSEVLLQLLTLSSRNSAPATPNNAISSLALALFCANGQSQQVLVNVLCQVVGMLGQQSQPAQTTSSNLVSKLILLLPLIQQIRQLQAQQVQQPGQHLHQQQFRLQMPQPHQQLSPSEASQQFQHQPASQSTPVGQNAIQEQLLQILQNAGLR